MIQKNEINQVKKPISGIDIDYQYYEKRARCLRSGLLRKWLGGRCSNKNYSSEGLSCR